MKTRAVTILLGGNIGEVKNTFNQAISHITKTIGPITTNSALYQSEAWGFDASTPFLNQVICVNTSMSPTAVLDTLLHIEKILGRHRKSTNGYASRTIDLDILFIEDLIIKTPNLEVPHPQIPKRLFTLMPLNEIRPNFIHPVTQQSINELFTNCQDKSKVVKL